MRKIVPYNRRDNEEAEIERILSENPDYEIVEIKNTVDGDFIVLEHKDSVELRRIEEEIQRMKELLIEYIVEDKISELKTKYKELKRRKQAFERKLKIKKN